MFKIISLAVMSVEAIQLTNQANFAPTGGDPLPDIDCPDFSSSNGFGKISTLSAGQQIAKAQAKNTHDDVLEEYFTKQNDWEKKQEKRDYVIDGFNTETITIKGSFDSRDEMSNSMWANTATQGDAKTTYEREAAQHLDTTTDTIPLSSRNLCDGAPSSSKF